MKKIYFLENRKNFYKKIKIPSFVLKRILINKHYSVYLGEDDTIFILYNKRNAKYLKNILENLFIDILEETEVEFIYYDK
ncbi:hypothetical protein [Garciella nitratireducens]|uniref:hypothetical protein n=1 Tax=Garciella nitratireducens TaxID=218205 RepID=UPI000DE8F281|nr:hypothetical protein [Garciella nitratireducens]RBP39199.1 hypothetical protein DFR81_11625 [Garciella nitratireducens]